MTDYDVLPALSKIHGDAASIVYSPVYEKIKNASVADLWKYHENLKDSFPCAAYAIADFITQKENGRIDAEGKLHKPENSAPKEERNPFAADDDLAKKLTPKKRRPKKEQKL